MVDQLITQQIDLLQQDPISYNTVLASLQNNNNWHLHRKEEEKSVWQACSERAYEELTKYHENRTFVFDLPPELASRVCSELATQESHRNLFFDDLHSELQSIFLRHWEEKQRNCDHFLCRSLNIIPVVQSTWEEWQSKNPTRSMEKSKFSKTLILWAKSKILEPSPIEK